MMIKTKLLRRKVKKKVKQGLDSSLDAHGWDTTHSINGQNDDKDKIIKKKSKKKVKQDLDSSLDAHGWDTTHSIIGQNDDKDKIIKKKSKKKEKQDLDSSLDAHGWDTTHSINGQNDDKDKIIKKKSKKKVKQDLDSSLDAHGWDTTHSINGQNDDKDKIIKKKSKKKVKQDLDSSLDAHGWDTTHSINGQNDDKDKIIKKKSKKKEKQDLDSSLDAHGWDTTHSINGQNDDKDKIIKKKSKKKVKQDLDSSLDAHGWDTTHSINGQNDDKDKIIKKKSKKKVKQDLDSSLDAHGWDTTHSIIAQDDDQENNSIKKKKKFIHLDSSLDTTETFLNTPYQDINSQVGDQENIVITKKKSKKEAKEGLYLSPDTDIVGCGDGHFRKKKKKSKKGSIMGQYNFGGDNVIEGMTGDHSVSPVAETRLGCEVTDEHLKKKKMKKGNNSNRHISWCEDTLTSQVCSDGLNDSMEYESYINDFPSDKSLLDVSSLSITESCPDRNTEQGNQDVGRPKENEQVSQSTDDYDFDDECYSVSYKAKAKKMGTLRVDKRSYNLYFDDDGYYNSLSSRRHTGFVRLSRLGKNRTLEERMYEFPPGVGVPQEEIEDIPLSHCHWTLVQEKLTDNEFTKEEIEEQVMGKLNYLRDYFKRLEMGQLTEEELKERRPTHYNDPYLPTPQHLKFFENLNIKITWELSTLHKYCLFNTLGFWFREIFFEETGLKVKSHHASIEEDLQLLIRDGHWTKEEDERMVKGIMKVMNVKSIEEVLYKKIPWIKIMPYVKTRRYHNLRQRFIYRVNRGDFNN
ncbi:Prothoracicostatic peptide-like [Homarus americanus]|uniref:Prothoracicostatic peptide-like n=1 Tax=Homarus americanus TaxID=6706 RepID=A0A8J5KFC5_HOMAM|nr:Prothoracicostatic peptide-like [Homarus americanus]